MNILFLSRWYPQPADNGSKIRITNLLRILCRSHAVNLISFFESSGDSSGRLSAIPGLQRVTVCPFRDFNPKSVRSVLGFMSIAPRYLIDTYSPEMDKIIRSEVQSTQPDLIIASQLSMAAYYKAFGRCPAILEELELGMFTPPEGEHVSLHGLRRRLTWHKHKNYVARLLRHFRACTVASVAERRLAAAAALGCCPVHVIPNFIDLGDDEGVDQHRSPESLVFTGSLRYQPNRDAVAWFIAKVFPLIKAQLPGVKLTVTGDPGLLPPPMAPGVTYAGCVRDVRKVLAASSVSIIPIRQGGGTRLKILDAMAVRTPIVTTSKGVEGIDARDGEHLLIADTPTEFAQSVLALLRRADFARTIAENAFSRLQSRYTTRAVAPVLLKLVGNAIDSSAMRQSAFAAHESPGLGGL